MSLNSRDAPVLAGWLLSTLWPSTGTEPLDEEDGTDHMGTHFAGMAHPRALRYPLDPGANLLCGAEWIQVTAGRDAEDGPQALQLPPVPGVPNSPEGRPASIPSVTTRRVRWRGEHDQAEHAFFLAVHALRQASGLPCQWKAVTQYWSQFGLEKHGLRWDPRPPDLRRAYARACATDRQGARRMQLILQQHQEKVHQQRVATAEESPPLFENWEDPVVAALLSTLLALFAVTDQGKLACSLRATSPVCSLPHVRLAPFHLFPPCPEEGATALLPDDWYTLNHRYTLAFGLLLGCYRWAIAAMTLFPHDMRCGSFEIVALDKEIIHPPQTAPSRTGAASRLCPSLFDWHGGAVQRVRTWLGWPCSTTSSRASYLALRCVRIRLLHRLFLFLPPFFGFFSFFLFLILFWSLAGGGEQPGQDVRIVPGRASA